MVEVVDEAGGTRMRDGGERRPGNPFIHSFEHARGHLLRSRPCTRQPACPYLGKCSQFGVKIGPCRESLGGPGSTLDSG